MTDTTPTKTLSQPVGSPGLRQFGGWNEAHKQDRANQVALQASMDNIHRDWPGFMAAMRSILPVSAVLRAEDV